MTKSLYAVGVLFAAALLLGGCETAPKTSEGREALENESRATLKLMQDRDAGLAHLLDTSYGYVIFPSVGKGGLIVGGAYGRGEVYERGNFVGYADLSQGSAGLQAGGTEYAELIVFESQAALNRFESSNFVFGANATAVALKAGASAAARFENGIVVFTMPKGGLMVEASISGQQFTFQSRAITPEPKPAQ